MLHNHYLTGIIFFNKLDENRGLTINADIGNQATFSVVLTDKSSSTSDLVDWGMDLTLRCSNHEELSIFDAPNCETALQGYGILYY
jgi:hypothetical protein